MIAPLICVVSIAALLQFFISYCRSLLAAHGKVALSEQVREAAGISGPAVEAGEFHRLLQLLRLCPARRGDERGIRFVGAYYDLMGFLKALVRPAMPGVAAWTERERANCSYFAAVTLDRRIAYSRELLAQQMGGRS